MRPNLLLVAIGVALAVPEVLLGANVVAGHRIEAVALGAELAAVAGAVLLGLGIGGGVLRRATRRSTVVIAVLVALACGVGGWMLSMTFPPPFVTTLAPAGVPTPNGLLNAAYLLLVVGAGTAALRLTTGCLAFRRRTAGARV